MVCPNCKAEISRFDLSVNCKKCGVNLYYSCQEQILSQDAKKCELEFASLRMFTAKLRAAFIASAPAIARIVFTVLCVAVLLIPFGSLKVSLPFYDGSVSFGGIGLYQAYSNGFLLLLPDMLKVSVTHDLALKSIFVIAAVALLLLTAAALLISEILSFINIRKGARVMRAMSVIGIVFSALSVVASVLLSSAASGFSQLDIKASMGFGGFAAAAVYAGMLVINHVFIARNIQPAYKEVDLLRVEMQKKVKAGEVSLDDLPLPIFESDEEREQRLKQEEEVRRIEEKEKREEEEKAAKRAASKGTGGKTDA